MRQIARITWLVLIPAFILTGTLMSKQIEGSLAPSFTLADVQGKKYDLTSMKASSMTIV